MNKFEKYISHWMSYKSLMNQKSFIGPGSSVIDQRAQLLLLRTSAKWSRPHSLFPQPNYVHCISPAQLRPYNITETLFNQSSGYMLPARVNLGQSASFGFRGASFLRFLRQEVSSCSSLAVSCNRTVLWDGESHVCRCKGKFSVPKI